jgi:hypothetical protein
LAGLLSPLQLDAFRKRVLRRIWRGCRCATRFCTSYFFGADS